MNENKKCEPEDQMYMSYPPQYRCKNCRKFWLCSEPYPTCHKPKDAPKEVCGKGINEGCCKRCETNDGFKPMCMIPSCSCHSCQNPKPCPLHAPKEAQGWEEYVEVELSKVSISICRDALKRAKEAVLPLLEKAAREARIEELEWVLARCERCDGSGLENINGTDKCSDCFLIQDRLSSLKAQQVETKESV